MFKKITTIFIFLLLSSGCSLTSNKFTIKKDDIQAYLQEKNDYSTPMDNIYHVKLTCFEKIRKNEYKESHNIQASQSIGNAISYQSSFRINEPVNNENKELSFGDFLEFYLSEDINGEYVSTIDYSKKELKNLSFVNGTQDSLNVVSVISISQEYYPTNKLPYKIFENKEETDICYATVKW